MADTLIIDNGSQTLTNKTIDANSNTLSNISITELDAATVVTEAEGISGNDNDTTIPTSAAVKDYADGVGAGGGVDTSGTPVDNDFAKFTDADTIEGRSYSEVKSDLGLEIGTDVQEHDGGLDDISGIAKTDGNIIVGNGANWVAESGATARTSLGAAESGGAEHDGFSDFVADEHIDHTTVTLTAGTGLTGGGDISSNRTFNVSGVTVSELAAVSVVTEAEGIDSNDNDTTLPTSAAVKDYVDTNAGVSAESVGSTEIKSGSDFGTSSKELLNFVLRDITSIGDWDFDSSNELTTTGSWADLDLTSLTSSEAVAVLLCISQEGSGGRTTGLRTNGANSNEYNYVFYRRFWNDGQDDGLDVRQYIVPADSGEVIEYYRSDSAVDIRINVLGWWEPAAT